MGWNDHIDDIDAGLLPDGFAVTSMDHILLVHILSDLCACKAFDRPTRIPGLEEDAKTLAQKLGYEIDLGKATGARLKRGLEPSDEDEDEEEDDWT